MDCLHSLKVLYREGRLDKAAVLKEQLLQLEVSSTAQPQEEKRKQL
jgi:hypothetical protein